MSNAFWNLRQVISFETHKVQLQLEVGLGETAFFTITLDADQADEMSRCLAASAAMLREQNDPEPGPVTS